jgi:hypothetical protein
LGFWVAVRPFLALHDLKPVPASQNGLMTHLQLRVVVQVRSSSWFGDNYLTTILVPEYFATLGTNFQQLAVETAQKRLE